MSSKVNKNLSHKDINIVFGFAFGKMNYPMKYNLVVLFTFLVFQTTAQKVFQYKNNLNVRVEGRDLLMPFAGGINAAQLQQIDLDGDGQEELVVWDKNAATLLVFHKSEGNYVHSPGLSYNFPEDISGFLILVDYDGDGKKDLFTGSPFGIKVYRNISVDGAIRWEVAQDFLRLDNRSNLQVNSLDVPAIMDVDGDGDLDIVTFNFASGDFLEYYQNTSVERKGTPDIDGFASAISRWGGFEFCGCDNFSFGKTCSGRPLSLAPTVENLKTEHAGGHSLLLRDFNGDGVLDMLMGQDECINLYYLVNEGSNQSPVFTAFDKKMPELGQLPQFPIFHAAYFVDGELVISTNSSATASEFKADYAQSLYRYEDNLLKTKSFLQEDMIDLGENTRPYFKGSAQAGELIITANHTVHGQVTGQAHRFLLSSSGLNLSDDDYLGLSGLGLTDLQYQEFLNAENQRSLFISGVEVINFTPVRRLYWSPDPTTPEFIEISLPDVQFRGNDHLEFFRYEGQNYLLLARQTGELIRYRINFSHLPEMELLDRDYLDFVDNVANRNLNVHIVKQGEQLDLYTVDQRGILEYIPDFVNNAIPASIAVQLENGSYVGTRLGRNTWISSIPSLGKNADLILGGTAGGLVYLKDQSQTIDPIDEDGISLKIYPNPAADVVNILSSSVGSLSLVNTLGQTILSDICIQEAITLELDLRPLSDGVYIVHLVGDSGKRLSKKLIVRNQ